MEGNVDCCCRILFVGDVSFRTRVLLLEEIRAPKLCLGGVGGERIVDWTAQIPAEGGLCVGCCRRCGRDRKALFRGCMLFAAHGWSSLCSVM